MDIRRLLLMKIGQQYNSVESEIVLCMYVEVSDTIEPKIRKIAVSNPLKAVDWLLDRYDFVTDPERYGYRIFDSIPVFKEKENNHE